MVYYITIDERDFEYSTTLEHAKHCALIADKKYPNRKIQIQVYNGNVHGDGGTLVKTLQLKGRRFYKL